MSKKYTLIEKEVITTLKTKEYIFTDEHKEKRYQKN